MSSPIESLLDKVDWKCAICGQSKRIGCDCQEKCSCGWTVRKGRQCGNSTTIRCSTKIKYGKWNRKTRRYEPLEPGRIVKKIALIDGPVNDQTVELIDINEFDEATIIPFPSEWPELVSIEFLAEQGFEVQHVE